MSLSHYCVELERMTEAELREETRRRVLQAATLGSRRERDGEYQNALCCRLEWSRRLKLDQFEVIQRDVNEELKRGKQP